VSLDYGCHSIIREAFDKSGKALFGWGQVPFNSPLRVNLRVERLVSGRFWREMGLRRPWACGEVAQGQTARITC
jgi:hypothetical protein